MSVYYQVSIRIRPFATRAALALIGALALVGALQAQTFTFSNTATITIPSSGTATPYPSTINVSGLSGTIVNISVRLIGYNHTFPDDVDVLLVGPAGTAAQSVVLMADVGGGSDVVNVDLVIEDGAAAMPDSSLLTSGTYAPTNPVPGDVFPAPAPAGPHGATFASMGLIGGPASAANGTWSLYVLDDLSADAGSFSGGWSITFTVVAPPQFAYAPVPGSTVTAVGGIAVGSTGNLTITPSIGTAGAGSGPGETTTLTCTAPTAPFFGFGQTVTAVGSGPISGGPLSGTCILGASAVTQTLTCVENRGGTPLTHTWTLSCPAGTLLPLTSTPASGSSITLPSQALGGTSTTATLQFQNPNAAAATVTCTAPAASQFTVSPLTINVPANGNASTTITYNSTVVGSFTGTLNCTAGTQSFTFTLLGSTVATSVDTLSPLGKLLLVFGVLGVGLLALRRP